MARSNNNDKNGSLTDAQRSQIRQALEELRRKLLDLNTRNSLLHFRYPKASVRVINALPDQICELLLKERQLKFRHIPEPREHELITAGYLARDEQTRQLVELKPYPMAEQWAQHLGYRTDYELPLPDDPAGGAGNHDDDAIQTALYPAELEAKLRQLTTRARSHIEETGANVLYLALGFLKWFESPASAEPRTAPLIVIPVRLERGKLNKLTSLYEYQLSWTGDEITTNLSLQERLKRDFSIALPVLEVGQDVSPEAYLKQVAEVIPDQLAFDRWAVQRHVTLSLFNFSKLLMYLDLNPELWVNESAIDARPMFGQLFAGLGEGDTRTDNVEYDIDNLPDVHTKYPLIEDADSSQHSALVDALDGKSLVIEGPPGTGKSQTITNLIGAALAAGKSVLFVAEKMAALEVVHRRLQRAGLEDFVLELHSHKTQKREVLGSLERRIKRRRRKEPDLQGEIRKYERLRKQLQAHATLINSQWRESGLTIHEILTRAVRCRTAADVHADPLLMAESRAAGLTSDDLRLLDEHAGDAAAAVQHVHDELNADAVSGHPWYGFANHQAQSFDNQHVLAALQTWQASLHALREPTASLAERILKRAAAELSLADLKSATEDLAKVPALVGNEWLRVIEQMQGEALEAASQYVEAARAADELGRSVAEQMRGDWCLRPGLATELQTTVADVLDTGVDQSASLLTLQQFADELGNLQASFGEIFATMEQFGSNLGPAMVEAFQPSAQGLRVFRDAFEALAMLPPRLAERRQVALASEDAAAAITLLQTEVPKLAAARAKLNSVFDLESMPALVELLPLVDRYQSGGPFRLFSGSWRRARQHIRDLLRATAELGDARRQLGELVRYLELDDKLGRAVQLQALPAGWFNRHDTPVADLRTLADWYRHIETTFGTGFGPTGMRGRELRDAAASVFGDVQQLVGSGFPRQLDEALAVLDKLQLRFPQVEGLANRALIGSDGSLAELQQRLQRAVDAWRPCLAELNRLTLTQLQALAGQAVELESAHTTLTELQAPVQTAIGDVATLPQAIAELDEAIISSLESTAAAARAVHDNIAGSAVRDVLLARPDAEVYAQLSRFGTGLRRLLQAERRDRAAFAELSALNETQWGADPAVSLPQLIERNDRASGNPQQLDGWLSYLRGIQRLRDHGLAAVADRVQAGTLLPQQIRPAAQVAVYEAMARAVLREHKALAEFAGNPHEQLQRRFQECDQQLQRLQREHIANDLIGQRPPAGVATGAASSLTEMGLIDREIAKKTRHVPIRQLVQRAGHSLRTLKPCFMMSPMSVAQFLSPGTAQFDLVVMDEASQVRTEEAIGALARSNQAIIVGDPKQLPPTSFFQMTLDDDDDEHAQAISQAQSVLEAAAPVLDFRRLRWHYRSEHESLIAFSNQHFYDASLVIFPTPYASGAEHGIRHTFVPRGHFKSSRNLEESRVVAAAVRNHMLDHPHESLGVVAMNAQQAEQIAAQVETLAKSDERFNTALDKNRGDVEPLFVKNLENVQGDERAVIFISFTYGPPEPGGTVYQRFGPINQDVGWRRLNVLFTRARRRVHAFTSMRSADVIKTATSSRGVRALSDYLAYAETGILHESAATGPRPPDSDFEIGVAEALSRHGFKSVPQVGVAGFYIDLAVEDPGRPGHYLMGIECDGATYHSAKSVRDRDRLRQMQLERLGWRIRRIWSTDWFKDPDGSLDPLIRELASLATSPPPSTPLADDEAIAEDVDTPPADSMSAPTVNAIIDKPDRADSDDPTDYAAMYKGDLQQALLRFNESVIVPTFPDTAPARRLLRPAMIECLVDLQPCTRAEFVERVPEFIRLGTDTKEAAQFIDRVLAIVESATYDDSN